MVYFTLLRPLASRCDDLSLALQIEEHCPEVNDALASTVQFLQDPGGTVHGSPSLRRAAIQRTLALSERCDFTKIIRRRGLRWLALAPAAAVLVAGHFLYHHTQFAHTALWRLADPFGKHTWTRIDLEDAPHRVAQGQPFLIKAQIAGIVPGEARLEVEGILKSDAIVPIKVDAKNPHAGSLVRAIDMTQQKGKFRFRLCANDALYPSEPGAWHEVEVAPPPKFAMLNGSLSPQIELRYPAYTDLDSPAHLSPGTKHIEAVAGTHVTYRAAFDRRLDRAWIEFHPENPLVRMAAFLSYLGHAGTHDLAATLALSQSVWGRVPARLDDGKTSFALAFVPWTWGTYALHVQDELGLVKDFEADLRIRQDPLPAVQLQRPASSTSVVPDAEIAFKMFVSDEEFAIRNVYVEYRKKDADNRWLDAGPGRLPLYDNEVMGRVVPRLLAGLCRCRRSHRRCGCGRRTSRSSPNGGSPIGSRKGRSSSCKWLPTISATFFPIGRRAQSRD